MASRATYSDADRARVYVALTANDGNVKRTARETSVPENTVRRWRDEWEKSGPPATDEVTEQVSSFVDRAEEVRDFALETLVEKIPNATPSALIAIVGVLDDKIARVRGLKQKSEVEHKLTLPSAAEVRELMTGFIKEAREVAATRAEEIVEAEIVEQPAKGLPAPRP